MAEYAKTYESLAAIWRVLAERSSREKPMSIAEIIAALDRPALDRTAVEKDDDAVGMAHTPSAHTVERILSGELDTLEALFPGFRVMVQRDNPQLLDSYVSDGKLHAVVENQEGEPLANGEMLLIVAPDANGKMPSRQAVDLMLQRLASYFSEKEATSRAGAAPLPYRLRCVAAHTQNGKVTYLPYDEVLKLREKTKKKPARKDNAGEKGKADAKDLFKEKDANNVARRYYLERILTPEQWRMLTDLIEVYPYLGERQTRAMLRALQTVIPGCGEAAGKRYAYKKANDALFKNLRKLDLAIREGKKVSIEYGRWELERDAVNGGWRPVLKKLTTSVMRERGEVNMVFDPYALMWSNGYYYLVGKHEQMMNLRLDRILRVTPSALDSERPKDFDPVAYRDRTPVMHPGEPEIVRMRCKLGMVSVVMDFFGENAEYGAPEDGWTNVTVRVAPKGAKLFAMQYADQVEVLEPESLRREMRASLSAALEKYGGK